jgi:hypothetical protein
MPRPIKVQLDQLKKLFGKIKDDVAAGKPPPPEYIPFSTVMEAYKRGEFNGPLSPEERAKIVVDVDAMYAQLHETKNS